MNSRYLLSSAWMTGCASEGSIMPTLPLSSRSSHA